MLTNYKNYLFAIALIGIISYTGLIKINNINLEHKLQLCNASYTSLQDKIKIANELRADQERKLRLREQEATQARVESQRRMDLILQAEIKGGCEGANQFMIQQAAQFRWDNNIP
jgi:hypothetical protein